MVMRGKLKWCLLGFLIAILLFLGGSLLVPGWLTGVIQWLAYEYNGSETSMLTNGQPADTDELVEMFVGRVGVIEMYDQPVVVLQEKGGERFLPIFIGFLEADAIAVIIEEIDMPRPLTSDLLVSILHGMGANVTHIVITDLKDDIFYARIIIDTHQAPMEIDARPSDAIAIALRTDVPIYVHTSVLDKAAIRVDQQTW
jgi:bifunctional DNase/RNase